MSTRNTENNIGLGKSIASVVVTLAIETVHFVGFGHLLGLEFHNTIADGIAAAGAFALEGRIAGAIIFGGLGFFGSNANSMSLAGGIFRWPEEVGDAIRE